MADTKITALTAITTVDPAADVLPIVDVSDTSMAASGTTKKITSNQILGAGGTATLASATITGDLTVDTSTLKVDSANNRVGIGTASPSYDLEIASAVRSSLAIRGNFAGGTDIAHLRFVNANGSIVGDIFSQNTNGGASDSAYLSFNTASSGTSSERYRIAADGVATWSNVGGVAGNAMTLNANGLGIGVTPPSGNSAGLGVGTLGSSRQLQLSMFGSYARLREWDATNTVALVTNINVDNGIDNNAIPSWKVQFGAGLDVFRVQRAAAGSSTFATLATLDASGNLGIGVTPSAWGTNKAIEGGVSGGKTGSLMFGSDGSNWLINNAIVAASTTYKASAAASYYYQNNGLHIWSNAPSGTAGNAITWTQAMTLDASGNLLVGSALPVSGGRISGNSSTGPAGRFFSSAGDNQFAAMFDKSSATNTTSQWLIGFTINNQATGSGQINANGASQAAFGTFSDSRLKENIVSLPSQLANILSLRPVEFDYKDGSGHQIGFVAQEMQEVYSDAVGEQNGFLTVTGWSKTEARLVSAIKELAAKVQALEAKLA